jgi:hypothetical protein
MINARRRKQDLHPERATGVRMAKRPSKVNVL